MTELIPKLFDIVMLPFTSGTPLVIIPVGFSFVLGCVMLVMSLIRRRY